jgi:hypothetical protein
MAVIISQDTDSTWYELYGFNYQYSGQWFTLADAIVIDKIEIYLEKSGSPTGTGSVVIKAVDAGNLPTGAALATSNTIDISTISTSKTKYTFTFSGGYSASSGKKCFYFDEGGGGNSSNKIKFFAKYKSAYAGGNLLTYSGSGWYDDSSYDARFILYSVDAGPVNVKSINSLAKSSCKSYNGLAMSSIKNINGLS